METVGLGYLIEHLDEKAPWNRTLSGGECQRLAFVRLMLHQPDIVVMDEATSALDPASQEHLMTLVAARLPNTAIVSIAHRPELEAFHDRKLMFERRPGGSRMIGDSVLLPPPTGLLYRIVAWLRRLRDGNGMIGAAAGAIVADATSPASGFARQSPLASL